MRIGPALTDLVLSSDNFCATLYSMAKKIETPVIVNKRPIVAIYLTIAGLFVAILVSFVAFLVTAK